MSSVAHRGYVHVGMDVSKDAIAVAVLSPDRDVAEVDKIFHDEESIRRLIKRLGRPSGLWACYEAGPTGYELHRLLTSMGVRCDVVAPSLIPKGSGDRVKTDRRDSRRLAGLHRAGELTAVAVPTPAQEAVRDLCRTRGDMVEDLTRARNRLAASYCVTRSSGGAVRRGPSATSDGCQGCTSKTGRWPRPSPTTWPPCVGATRPSTRSRPICFHGVGVSPSGPRCLDSAPTGESPASVGCAWPPRSSTGGASPEPGRS